MRIPSASATVAGVALVAVVASILPASAQLTAPGSFDDVPASWRQAAAWLDERDEGDRALLLPSSSFGEYGWGRPLDEPLGVLTDHDWAVRDLIPLGGNGSTRVLDAVDRALQGDVVPEGFTEALRRAGVRYLVVRNDLDLARTRGPRPASVRRVLAAAPEVELVASFGDVEVDPGSDARLSARPGDAATEAIREVDVWQVRDPTPVATAYPTAGALLVGGGPEAALQLPPSLLEGRAMVLAVDPAADEVDDPVLVTTDTARRRDVVFGTVRNNATYTLTQAEVSPLTGTAPVDRWPADEPIGLTVARVEGVARISDSRRPGEAVQPANQPFAAFDGDPDSTWAPATDRALGAWVEVELDEAADVGSVLVSVPSAEGRRVEGIEITTDAGAVEATIGVDGSVAVDLPDGPTTTVRVTITSLTGSGQLAPLGLSEVAIDGLEVARPLVSPLVPEPPASGAEGAGTGSGPGGADVVSVARDRADRFDLRRRDVDTALDRVFAWSGRTAALSGWAVSVPGPGLDAVIAGATATGPGDVVAQASSVHGREPALAASAAVDGDPATAWVSDLEAEAPRLALRWADAVVVDRVEITPFAKDLDRIDAVQVTIGGTTVERDLPPSGVIDLPTTTTDEIELAFPSTEDRSADDADDPDAPGRRVGIAEVRIPALLGRTAASPDRSAVVDLPCGDGPAVWVDDQIQATTASPTVGELIDGTAFAWEACEPLPLPQADHRLRAPSGPAPTAAITATFEPVDGIDPVAPARAVDVTSWGREGRQVQIAAGERAFLATTENHNEGWRATLDGDVLHPVRLDGWRQGWIVPAGDGGTITLTYAPGRVQRIGLFAGMAALAALVAVAVGRPRRAGTWSPPPDRPWARPWIAATTVATAVALGGLLVIPAAAVTALARARNRLVELAAAAVLTAGLVAFVQSAAAIGSGRGTFSPAAQTAAVVALVALGASALPRDD